MVVELRFFSGAIWDVWFKNLDLDLLKQPKTFIVQNLKVYLIIVPDDWRNFLRVARTSTIWQCEGNVKPWILRPCFPSSRQIQWVVKREYQVISASQKSFVVCLFHELDKCIRSSKNFTPRYQNIATFSIHPVLRRDSPWSDV